MTAEGQAASSAAATRVEPFAARKSPRRFDRRLRITATQAAIVVVALLAWQFLPTITPLAKTFRFLDPYFISSPSRVFVKLRDMITGQNGAPVLWDYLAPTLWQVFLGVAIGMALGALAGLVLSETKFGASVLVPMVIASHTVPSVALVPIFVILFGPSPSAVVALGVFVLFFVTFFSAYEGGLSVPDHMVQNAQIMGASRIHVMRHVRLPFVLAWTAAVMPLAVTTGLLVVIVAQVLSGQVGLGKLILTATANADADLTFSVALVSAIVGLVFVGLASIAKNRLLHWWQARN